ncbi:MAG TPA: alpha/beta fold hydrolase [Pseudomonadales bacterium]
MNRPIFFIPGFHGSGAGHWQTWLQNRLPHSSTLRDVDWEFPELSAWADQAHHQIASAGVPPLLVAHSFGCLVAAVVAAENPRSVAGIVFVAPANPDRFAAAGGLRNTSLDGTPQAIASAADILPERLPRQLPTTLLASENDPWLDFSNALVIARRWNSHFVDLGEAGHVNAESGYGPWPGLLRQLQHLRNETTPDFTVLHRAALEAGELPHEREDPLPRVSGMQFAM